ncbi:MAG: CoA transferase [Nocardioides sp.]
MEARVRQGPLAGLRVVEVASLGPGPFGAMILADLGAEIVRIEQPRTHPLGAGEANLLNRGRDSIAVDLKAVGAAEFVLGLCEQADVLVEGYRPGVMERLGLGPDVVLARAPALVYARMTGYGQEGPLAAEAGHDINYLAAAGVLDALPRADGVPTAPLNLVGDMGGGGMMLAVGVLAGVLQARASGHGQVVDVAMTDGSALLAMLVYMLRHTPEPFTWTGEPGRHFLDGGSHFYGAWLCADGRFMATGAVEPEFYAALMEGLGFDAETMPQWDRSRWPEAPSVGRRPLCDPHPAGVVRRLRGSPGVCVARGRGRHRAPHAAQCRPHRLRRGRRPDPAGPGPPVQRHPDGATRPSRSTDRARALAVAMGDGRGCLRATPPTRSDRVMSLPPILQTLRLPVVGAPMLIASGPELVIAQCTAGVVGSFPALNARPQSMLRDWLDQIEEETERFRRAHPDRVVAPYAVNQIVHKSNDRFEADLDLIVSRKVPIVITGLGARAEVFEAIHSYGGIAFHDVINDRFARKAVERGADGIIAVAAGAGGHAGTLSPFALVQEIRELVRRTAPALGRDRARPVHPGGPGSRSRPRVHRLGLPVHPRGERRRPLSRDGAGLARHRRDLQQLLHRGARQLPARKHRGGGLRPRPASRRRAVDDELRLLWDHGGQGVA